MNSTFVVDFIAGWVGGIFCVVTGYPFDTIKVRQQNFSTSFLIAARETYKYEGVLGFFKGISSPLIAYGPSNSIFFGCTGACMKTLSASPNTNKNSYLCSYFFSGCVGGFLQAAVMCPVELIKIVLQTSTEGKSPWVHNRNILKFEGTMQAYKTIFKIKGMRGFYRGFMPMLVRDVPTSGVYFVVYESLLPSYKQNIQWYHKIWAGGLAGIVSISTVLPADVVKTRMQADDILYPSYSGMTDCIRKLYNDEGIRIFWKGLPIITIRAFPAHAMLFLGYEMTLDFLGGKKI